MESTQELNFLTTLLPVAIIVFIIAIGVVLLNQNFRKNLYRQMLEQEELKNKHHYHLLRSSIEVQEAERKRIAHDLHDEIGVLLTTSRLYFNQLSLEQTEAEKQVSDKMNSLFDEMMINIRRISHDLRPVVLENLGLVEAVESLREKLLEAGMDFTFEHQVSFRMTKESELVLYRILQELIGNTLKHAQASQIFISMKEQGKQFYLTYKDDGKGLAQGSYKGGLGMKSIESRLNLLDSKMQMLETQKGVHFLMIMDLQKLNQDE